MKSSDYYIIKLRYYTTKYYLKKFHQGDSVANKKHYDAAKKHGDFFWKFIEFVSGQTSQDVYTKYFTGSRECITEEIFETHGIIISNGEGWYTYLIPKDSVDIIKWINDNVGDIPHKEIKKYNMWWYENYLPSSLHRDMYRDLNEKMSLRIKNKEISL